MKYKAIVFDWDGTLMDSTAKIVACVHDVAKQAGLPIPTKEQAKDIIGLSLLPAIQKLFAIEDEETAAKLATHYKASFTTHQHIPSPLFPGATGLLESLKEQGYILAVATGKGRIGLEKAWEQSDTKHYFHLSRCSDDAQSKPSPDMLEQILRELELSAHEVLMVGDTTYDMQMAQSINVDRVAVSFGVHEPAALKQHAPIAIIDALHELHQHV